MAKAEMKIGEISKPRFEFRTFGQNFDEASKLMARLSLPVPKKVWERESKMKFIFYQKQMILTTRKFVMEKWILKHMFKLWMVWSNGIH